MDFYSIYVVDVVAAPLLNNYRGNWARGILRIPQVAESRMLRWSVHQYDNSY